MLRIRICIGRPIAGPVVLGYCIPPFLSFESLTLPRPVAILRALPLLLFAGLLSLPVLALLGAWLPWGRRRHLPVPSCARWRPRCCRAMSGRRFGLPCGWGGDCAGRYGGGSRRDAVRFPGRRMFEWLLLLPLAMPAYVTAYAYTDFLQFSGPLQVGLREAFGLEGRLLPEVRSLWGAIWVFCLRSTPMSICWRARPWASAPRT